MSVQKPDFENISLFDEHDFITKEQWQEQVKNEIDTSIDDLLFETNEQIQLKPLYTSDDREGIQHLDDLPGIPPFTRGPYLTMYVNRPWTVRQYAGFSTAEESNAFYRRNLAMGQKACRLPLI